MAILKNSQEGEDLQYDRLVNFATILLFYIISLRSIL
jgi:hypothetical protein